VYERVGGWKAGWEGSWEREANEERRVMSAFFPFSSLLGPEGESLVVMHEDQGHEDAALARCRLTM